MYLGKSYILAILGKAYSEKLIAPIDGGMMGIRCKKMLM